MSNGAGGDRFFVAFALLRTFPPSVTSEDSKLRVCSTYDLGGLHWARSLSDGAFGKQKGGEIKVSAEKCQIWASKSKLALFCKHSERRIAHMLLE